MLAFFFAVFCFAIAVRRVAKIGISPTSALLMYYSLGFMVYTYCYWFEITKGDVNVGFFIKDIPLSTTYTATPLLERSSDLFSATLVFCVLFGAVWLIPTRKRVPVELPGLSRLKMARIPAKKDVFSSLMVVTLFILGLEIWHAMNIPWDQLWYFTDYQTFKHPDGLGITNPLLRIFHFQMKVSGLILFGLSIYAADNKKYGLFAAALIASLYPLFFNMITNSRFIISYPALIILLGLAQKRPLKITLGVLTFLVLFNLSITGRSRGEYGISTYTFDYIWNVIMGIPNAVVGVVVNVFDTFFNIGRALYIGGEYGTAYKTLSFSPLPSVIDQFSKIRTENIRISNAVPFSAFSEAFLFGWGYFIVLVVGVVMMVTMAQRLHEKVDDRIGIVIIAWALVVNQLLCQYPIRNGFRFVILSCIVFGFAARAGKKQLQKRQAQARAPAPAPHYAQVRQRTMQRLDRPRPMYMRR